MKALLSIFVLLFAIGICTPVVMAQGTVKSGPDPSTLRDPELEKDSMHNLEVARNYGADRRQMFVHVLLPGSMPLMLTGLRLSANVAFHSTIGVEMIGSRTGMGAMLWLSWQTFRIDHLYAILVVIAAIGIALATLIRWVAHRSAPWMSDRSTAA